MNAMPRGLVVISLTYLLYFGQLGILSPYLGLFLDGRGFSSLDIGSLYAIITLTRIIGPSLWAGVADKRGSPLKVMQIGCGLTVVCFTLVFFAYGFIALTATFALMMMFWTAVLPQLEVVTLNQLSRSQFNYGSIRLWGSIGFIICSAVTGVAIDYFGSEAPIYASMLVLTGLFLASLGISPIEVAETASQKVQTWSAALRRPFVVFIVSSLMLQMSFGAFYGFFALYMKDLGYSGGQTGALVGVGVLAEVGIFLVAATLINRWGVKKTLFICLLLTGLRWILLGTLGQWWVIVVFTQVIHALSFGLTHATSVHFIHHFFPAQFQSRGQAIYIGASFGIGGAIGLYVAGALWQDGSGATLTFVTAGIMSLIGAVALLLTSSASMEKRTAAE